MANTTAPKSAPMLLKAKSDFVCIESKEAIAKVPANKIVRFSFDKELLAYCQNNGVVCAVEVANIAQAIFANHYQAAYIIAPKTKAEEIQQIADSYLFDSKILVEIRFEWEMERLAHDGIDGVILEALL